MSAMIPLIPFSASLWITMEKLQASPMHMEFSVREEYHPSSFRETESKHVQPLPHKKIILFVYCGHQTKSLLSPREWHYLDCLLNTSGEERNPLALLLWNISKSVSYHGTAFTKLSMSFMQNLCRHETLMENPLLIFLPPIYNKRILLET